MTFRLHISAMSVLTAVFASCFTVIISLPVFAQEKEATPVSSEWRPVDGILLSRFAPEVHPDAVLPEYPRPQMVRNEWLSLNGLWDYAIEPAWKKEYPGAQGKILVPFPAESALSGVGQRVGKENNLWYWRTFRVPESWSGKRILLHFDALDWSCTVWVNGREVGSHQGAYDPFVLDVTDALHSGEEQEVLVCVWDPTDDGFQPVGKQTNKPFACWYTPVTGIWQSVWLEPVAESSISRVLPVSSLDQNGQDSVQFRVSLLNAQPDDEVRLSGSFEGQEETRSVVVRDNEAEMEFSWPVGTMKYWSPDTPVLYQFKAELVRSGQVTDEVASYFALRKISVGKGSDGFVRLFLNNEELFQYGPLDQGWWPDGLYTPPTESAIIYDIELTKKLGFNMLRKHVKVEPARFYYHCDRLGLLVWQDMPSGDPRTNITQSSPESVRTPESADIFLKELDAMLHSLEVYPCIVMWVPFNEGWGQFQTEAITKRIREHDPSRLINSASGWTDYFCGDVCDIHSYPGPVMTFPEESRAAVLGEFGGLGYPLPGHLWNDHGENWGYVSFDKQEELFARYEMMNKRLRALMIKGLAAAVYTQTTDLEGEVNGLLTYDRKVLKMPLEKLNASNRTLWNPVTDEERTQVCAESSCHGCLQYKIQFLYHQAIIVVPKTVAPGRPWYWLAESPEKNPASQTLLEQGYHLAYLAVPPLPGATEPAPEPGSPRALYMGQEFYKYLTRQAGFEKQVHLDQTGRNDPYLKNWSAAYPEQVKQ